MKYFVQDSHAHRLSQTKTWISNAICRGLFVFNNLWWLGVIWFFFYIRDRPFNLQGGGYGFLFRSEKFFRTTQELEYLYFLLRKARIFFPEFNIRLYDKNSESDYFFFPPPNQNIIFSNIGNQNIFIEKNP